MLIERIKRDPTLQLRDGGLDMERIEDMRAAIVDGVAMPPVTVVGDEDLLADGFHRVYSAEKEGLTEVEAIHVEGGYADALAIAIRGNSNGSKQLTRTERKEGIKRLLKLGWTQERVAKATGIHQTTVMDIHNSLAMRGEVTKPAGEGKAWNKPVAVLPVAVHSKLRDTTLTRIADAPYEQQQELAEAVAEVGLPEPRVREAVRDMKERGTTPTEAVAKFTQPAGMALPIYPSDVSMFLQKRVEAFLTTSFRYRERDMTFEQALDFVAEQGMDKSASDLADVLAKTAVLFDTAASRLRSRHDIRVVSA